MTASIVADALDMPVFGLEGIHESGGIYLEDADAGNLTGLPGKTPVELQAAFPRLVLTDEINPKGWWNRPFESRENRPKRASQVLAWLLQKHGDSDDQVALFSHGGFYNYLVAAMMGMQDAPPIWFDMNNCGVSRFDLREDHFIMLYHNRIEHLQGSLITK